MPLTDKGQKILSSFKSQYGAEKGEQYFYASKNAGRIKNVDSTASDSLGDVIPSDEDITPEREPELDGMIPTEEGGYEPDAPNLPEDKNKGNKEAQSAKDAHDEGINVVGSMPETIKVGDSSLANWNKRNRNFWKI